MADRRKTNPDHKARFSYGVSCSCSCGWKSGSWFGKGARGQASAEWHDHRDKCERAALSPTSNGGDTDGR